MANELPNWNLNVLDPMDDDSKPRFIFVSKDNVDELIAQQEKKTRRRKKMYDLNIVLKFLREVRIEGRPIAGAECIERFQMTSQRLCWCSKPFLWVELFSYVNAFFCSNKFA